MSAMPGGFNWSLQHIPRTCLLGFESLPNPNRGADTTSDGFNNGVWHMATP